VNVPVCTKRGVDENPQMTGDGQGGAIIVWNNNTYDQGVDVWAQRVSADGIVQWGPNGVPVCRAEGNQGGPEIISDGAGGAIIAWSDQRILVKRGGHNAIFAQRLDPHGRPLWRLNGVPIDTTGNGVYMTPDGRGGAFLAFGDDRTGWLVKSDVYAQHIDARGRSLWTFGGVPVCTEQHNQAINAVVPDGRGGLIAMWEDDRAQDGYNDLYAQRIDSLGTVQWSGDGITVAQDIWGYSVDGFLADGLGGAFVTWISTGVSYASGPHAQHLNAAGALLWPAPGLLLGGGNNCYYPYLTTDMAGGFICCWEDGRGFYAPYAQRVSATGQVLWAADGVLLANTGMEFPQLASDGAGGAIVAWNDYRTGANIYGQRVLADGTIAPGWPTNGRAISTAAGGQQFPVVLAVPGGAIVAWEDWRNNSLAEDLYAQRVLLDGTLGAPDDGRAPDGVAPLVWSVTPPQPNPTRTALTLAWTMPEAGDIAVEVFDAAGRRVRDVVHAERAAGAHTLAWDLRDEAGRRVPAGIYTLRLAAPGHTVRQRVAVLQP
jgi:hypothetical protein